MKKTGLIALIVALVVFMGCSISDKLGIKKESNARVTSYADNPHYYNGMNNKPVFMVGSYSSVLKGKHYGPQTMREAFKRMEGKANYFRYEFFIADGKEGNFNPGCQALNPFKRVERHGTTYKNDCKKFDLTQFNEEFFDELRKSLAYAEERGIYVHISIFNHVLIKPKRNSCCGFKRHPFYQKNNINNELIGDIGWEADNGGISGEGSDKYYDVEALKGDPAPSGRRTAAQRKTMANLQKAYVEKIINETKDFSNVFYEVGNEVPYCDWLNYWVQFIRERTDIAITVNHRECKYDPRKDGVTAHRIYFNENKDQIIDFYNPEDPMVFGLDTDGASSDKNQDDGRKASWLAFVSGYGMYGDYLWPEDNLKGFNLINRYFDHLLGFIEDNHVKFWKMAPHHGLTSKGRCLADPGREYVIYSATGGTYKVDLENITGKFDIKWYNPITGAYAGQRIIQGGAKKTCKAPFEGDAVLYIYKRSAESEQQVFNIPPEDSWDKKGVVLKNGPEGSWDHRLSGAISPATMVKKDGKYFLYYIAGNGTRSDDGGPEKRALGVAISDNGENFTKSNENPVIEHIPHNNEEEGIFSSAATVNQKGNVVLYYSAIEARLPPYETINDVVSNIDMVTSPDGIRFSEPEKVVSRDDDRVWGHGDEISPLGVVQRDDGKYILYYTAVSRGFNWSLGVATGKDKGNFVSFEKALHNPPEDKDGIIGGADLVQVNSHEILLPLVRNFDEGFIDFRRASLSSPADLGNTRVKYYGEADQRHTLFFLDKQMNKWFMFFRKSGGNEIYLKTHKF